MFYKKKGKPEIGEVILCTVKKILPHSVFVNLDEYENLEGMVHISEIAPGRIRNLRDYVIEGKRIVCKVLSINSQGNIDLSLRRVGTGVMLTKINDYKQEEKAEKLLEQVGKELKLDLKILYQELGIKAIEEYGGLYNFFQTIVESGKIVVDKLTTNQKLIILLVKTVQEKIKPIELSVNGILTIKSYRGDGIDLIKNILKKIKDKGIEITYLGAPKYKISSKAFEYKKAENLLKESVDLALEYAKKNGCEVEFLKNGWLNIKMQRM